MECVGFSRWIASLVISVRIGSIGTIRKLTPNTAATPENAAASPASGCRPRLREEGEIRHSPRNHGGRKQNRLPPLYLPVRRKRVNHDPEISERRWIVPAYHRRDDGRQSADCLSPADRHSEVAARIVADRLIGSQPSGNDQPLCPLAR